MCQGNEGLEQMVVGADFCFLHEQRNDAYRNYTTLHFYMSGLAKEDVALCPHLFTQTSQ
jgi:hypothetical protein